MMTCPYCGGRLERHPYSELYSCDTCEYDQEELVTNPDKGFLCWCDRMFRAPVIGALNDYEEWIAAMPR